MNTKLQITQQDERGIGYNCKGCIKGKQPHQIFLRHLNCQRLWTVFSRQEAWLSVFISNVPQTCLVWHHHQYHHHHIIIITNIIIIITNIIIIITRPKPAYGRQGLDWIFGPGYSFVVFSTNRGDVTSLTGGSNWPPLTKKTWRHWQGGPTDL